MKIVSDGPPDQILGWCTLSFWYCFELWWRGDEDDLKWKGENWRPAPVALDGGVSLEVYGHVSYIVWSGMSTLCINCAFFISLHPILFSSNSTLIWLDPCENRWIQPKWNMKSCYSTLSIRDVQRPWDVSDFMISICKKWSIQPLTPHRDHQISQHLHSWLSFTAFFFFFFLVLGLGHQTPLLAARDHLFHASQGALVLVYNGLIKMLRPLLWSVQELLNSVWSPPPSHQNTFGMLIKYWFLMMAGCRNLPLIRSPKKRRDYRYFLISDGSSKRKQSFLSWLWMIAQVMQRSLLQWQAPWDRHWATNCSRCSPFRVYDWLFFLMSSWHRAFWLWEVLGNTGGRNFTQTVPLMTVPRTAKLKYHKKTTAKRR